MIGINITISVITGANVNASVVISVIITCSGHLIGLGISRETAALDVALTHARLCGLKQSGGFLGMTQT